MVPGKHWAGKWRIEWELGEGARLSPCGRHSGEVEPKPRGLRNNRGYRVALEQLEDGPDLVEPLGVFGLHQDGAEGGDGGAVAVDGGGDVLEKGDGELGQGEVEIFGGGGFEDSSGLGGDFGEGCRFALWTRREDYDVEFGFEGWDEFFAGDEFFVEG